MREQYWAMYSDLKHRCFYYSRFLRFFNAINWIVSGFLTITSVSSIAIWTLWGKFPLVWSSLICISQVIQALWPKLPYNDLIVTTKLMICSLDDLLLSIDKDWMESEYVRNFSEQEYLDLISKYQNRYHELISQYYSGTFLPELKYLHKIAEDDCRNYFNHKYPSN